VKVEGPETVIGAEPERVADEQGVPVKDTVGVANEEEEGGSEIVLLPQRLTEALSEGLPVELEVPQTVRVPLIERDTEVDMVAVLEKEALEEAVRVLQ
jgi:hypothetical protein